MAKQFFYVCAGILLLVASYGLGASRAESQTTPNRVVGITSFSSTNDQVGATYRLAVVTENGDVHWNPIPTAADQPWRPAGNVFGGVQVEGTSWGKVKGEFKK